MLDSRSSSWAKLAAPMVALASSAVAFAAPTRPNVVIILADDLGWKDLSCYGSDFYKTPNIDRLADQGVRFTQAYAACPVCSPSRAALLTGKYPARLHVTDWIPGQMPENPRLLVPDWTKYLPLEEKTIADRFRAVGYATASIGKWHLGGEPYYPDKHGFDLNLAGTDAANTKSYFAPYNIATLPEGPDGEYITDRLAEEAARWIATNRDRPFFLYLPHFAVHTPIQAKKKLIEQYRAAKGDAQIQTNERYAAMLHSLDQAVGRVRKQLDDLHLSDRTIIVFASDNGGRIPTTSNLPLRAGKGSCYEGGTRVPLIVHWPGVTRPGVVTDVPTITMDLVPTLLEAAGLEAATSPLDGISLAPLLRGDGAAQRDELFWHYPHYQHYQLEGTTPYSAIRKGAFRLIEFLADGRVELYDLSRDVGEKQNLANEMPEKVQQLRQRLHEWRKEVGAQMPTTNPAYDPSRAEHETRAATRRATTTQAAQMTSYIERVPPRIADRQAAQPPDAVHLSGWLGSRITANEANRLVKLDPDRLLEGYRKRPGRQAWDGEHVGKWLHAASLAWANTGDPALRGKLDLVVNELQKCQLDDGYLGTYIKDQRWTEWDVWAHKYNLIGLLTYMRCTGNMQPLDCCRQMADLLCSTFGDAPGQRDIIRAGQHMGMAPTSVLEPMVLLYRLTGEQRYLDFCNYILRAWEHPNGPKIVSTLLNEKRVDKVGNGKAYEMVSCLNGALEYYRTIGDEKLLRACLNAWQDIVDNRLYITGTASYREFFHADHDLPNVNNVGETCVTVTWLQFNAQLLRLTGEARFAEQLERTALNQLLGAQSPDGSAWGYYVQMQGKKPYSSTLDGHCCLSSGPRGVALIPTFAIGADADGLVVNLYDAATGEVKLADGAIVKLALETSYPSDAHITVNLVPAAERAFSVKLRIPAWCDAAKVQVNQQLGEAQRGSDGYLSIHRTWKDGDRIELDLPLRPRVDAGAFKNEGKAALLYGPLVLAADEALLPPGATLNRLTLSTADLPKRDIRPEPAPADRKTWSNSQLFRASALIDGSASAIRLVPFADAGMSGSLYKVWLPCGRTSPDRNLLLDGVESRSRKPNHGSIIDGFQTVATTFTNKKAEEDWYAVELDEPVTVGRLVFVHGTTAQDGGWFDASAGKPRLQLKKIPGGQWEDCCEIQGYPTTTATDPAGLKDGQQFNCEVPAPIEIVGVRIIGRPSSGDNPRQSWSSCSELQAFPPRR